MMLQNFHLNTVVGCTIAISHTIVSSFANILYISRQQVQVQCILCSHLRYEHLEFLISGTNIHAENAFILLVFVPCIAYDKLAFCYGKRFINLIKPEMCWNSSELRILYERHHIIYYIVYICIITYESYTKRNYDFLVAVQQIAKPKIIES